MEHIDNFRETEVSKTEWTIWEVLEELLHIEELTGYGLYFTYFWTINILDVAFSESKEKYNNRITKTMSFDLDKNPPADILEIVEQELAKAEEKIIEHKEKKEYERLKAKFEK